MNTPLNLDGWFDGSEPGWLRACVQQYADLGDVYNAAIAAGLYRALMEEFDSMLTRQSMTTDEFLGWLSRNLNWTNTNSAAVRTEEWVDALTAPQVDEALALAVAELESMHMDLAELSETLDPDDPAWVIDFTDMLIRRDDLDRVFNVLNRRDDRGVLGAGITIFDRAFKPFLAAMPVHLDIRNRRLAFLQDLFQESFWTAGVRNPNAIRQ